MADQVAETPDFEVRSLVLGSNRQEFDARIEAARAELRRAIPGVEDLLAWHEKTRVRSTRGMHITPNFSGAGRSLDGVKQIAAQRAPARLTPPLALAPRPAAP